jgi:hypothetical protein
VGVAEAEASMQADCDSDVERAVHAPLPALPDAAYDGPLYVQNTFIHFAPNQPASLVDFFKERQVRSCPSSRLLEAPTPGSGIEAAVLEGYAEATPINIGGHLEFYTKTSAEAWSGAAAPVPEFAPTLELEPVQVLRLADMLAEPQMGSDEMPNVGSLGHEIGRCKPCAFIHTKGCADGVDCKFCHLCEPGEKKKRSKEKLAFRREIRAQREAQHVVQQDGSIPYAVGALSYSPLC